MFCLVLIRFKIDVDIGLLTNYGGNAF